MIFRASEDGDFDPGRCPACDGTEVQVDWIHVPMPDDEDQWVPGTIRCLNRACVRCSFRPSGLFRPSDGMVDLLDTGAGDFGSFPMTEP